MSITFTRRGFLATGAAFTALHTSPIPTSASERRLRLAATTRIIDIDGKAATVLGLENQDGGQGLVLEPGERFRLELENRLAEDTIIHWHGQIPPNRQDGVPDMPLPMLKPGERRGYNYEPLIGTHWMHAHVPDQEMRLLAAPLIVRSAEDMRADRQEVVMFLHDFSFTPPEELLAGLQDSTGAHGSHGTAPSGMPNMSGMDHGGTMMSGGAMEMDLNDIDFDAYLANDRTLSDPDIVRVERGGQVLLRIVNASAATVFFIDTGALETALVAVDGHPVKPVRGRRFGIAMAQRLDLLLALPPSQGAFPILALREGARERTGIVLATPEAAISRIENFGETAAPVFDLTVEARLEAVLPLPERPAEASKMVMLGGSMSPYEWTINGEVWENRTPITARTGQRLEMMLHNMSMMGHPMHLHGHSFQVVAINGKRLNGAVRDTVYVPPMAMVTLAVDPGEAARWMFHCHHMPHMAAGMMTEFAVTS